MTENLAETESSTAEQHFLRGWRSVIFARSAAASDVGAEATACAWPRPSSLPVVLRGSRGGRPAGIQVDDFYMRFPVVQIAVFMAVAAASLPYLTRGVPVWMRKSEYL
jgi:hypothetical protein